MRGIGLALLRAGRLNPLEMVRGHRCKDQAGIAKMIAKARALEERRRAPARS
jgi:quinone-modifying oxidoreductase subunit QmoC